MHQSQGFCPICSHKETAIFEDASRVEFICWRCGKFASSPSVLLNKLNFSPQQIAAASGWLSENQEAFLPAKQLRELAGLGAPTIGAKADKILRFFAELSPLVGTQFILNNTAGYGPAQVFDNGRHVNVPTAQLVGRAWAVNETEAYYLLTDFLVRELGQLEPKHGGYQITPKGWARLDALRNANPQSTVGFIAMWFDSQMTKAWKAIERGIDDSGYQPLRIDQRQHNNKIDDEIVAAIRGSRFVVSDFTGHRGGVYFEAGFAMGLGIPVIWLCRKDELDKAHFDTRQYNFILWEQANLADLTKALKNRIEATIGRGPIPETNKQ